MTKEEIKQKYEDTAILIISRINVMLNNENFENLEIVHKIQSDIDYHLKKTDKEIQDDLLSTLEQYKNPYM